jgi:hypothetical protein
LGYVIEARSYEQQEGEFSAELWIEEHEASGVTETQFYLPDTFPTEELAIEAAIQPGGRRLTRDLSGDRRGEWVRRPLLGYVVATNWLPFVAKSEGLTMPVSMAKR